MLGPTGGAEKPKKSHFRTHFPNPSGHTLSQFVGFAAFPGLAVSAHPRGPVRGGVVSGGVVTGTRWTVGRGGRIRRGRVIVGAAAMATDTPVPATSAASMSLPCTTLVRRSNS